ncbi:hypothetical protein E0Z10_g7679 [Xylaria hypoxylon]|uniref:Mid2 domain-containing protein n=1 Tax=Xylaria hypoxylon TaxID=37992 RepID=A0A4Z0YD84_9PEZI|nr:hypothetical protein E0Z10_g7679 [Xylaria hypoxylon]
MTTPSPTLPPTLPADWTPTSSGCLRTEDYWIWDFNATAFDARTVLGGPSQTTNCFASTWDPTITYQETWSAGVHGEWFRCVSRYDNQEVMTLTRTDFQQNTIAMGTRTRKTSEHLFALALMYTTPTSTSTTISSPISSPDPSTTGTPSGDTSSGLSAGAAAGIGVGAATAVITLALSLWFIYRRRMAARPLEETSQFPTPETYTTENPHVPSQYLAQPLVASPPPKEPAGELPADQQPVFELYGDSNGQQSRVQ